MKISGKNKETYLFLNGIGVTKALILSDGIELLPATCSPDPSDIIQVSKSEINIGVILIFLRRVSSQLHITADDPKTLAKTAWNSIWDAILLDFRDAKIAPK